jgi:hypothetical protein
MVVVRDDHVVVIAYGAADSRYSRGAERMRTERGLSVGMLLTAGIGRSIHKRDVGGSGFSVPSSRSTTAPSACIGK